MRRIRDRDPIYPGAWPITGLWCSVCGWPLHPVNERDGHHPTCNPNPDKEQ